MPALRRISTTDRAYAPSPPSAALLSYQDTSPSSRPEQAAITTPVAPRRRTTAHAPAAPQRPVEQSIDSADIMEEPWQHPRVTEGDTYEDHTFAASDSPSMRLSDASGSHTIAYGSDVALCRHADHGPRRVPGVDSDIALESL